MEKIEKRGITGSLVLIVLIVILIFIFVAIFFGIPVYNDLFGHSCSLDSDCNFICGVGAVNYRYTDLSSVNELPACGVAYPICEANKCEILTPEQASLEDCERVYDDYAQAFCYQSFAKKLNKSSLCKKIKDNGFKENCLGEFKND